jgi:hypothetical protein
MDLIYIKDICITSRAVARMILLARFKQRYIKKVQDELIEKIKNKLELIPADEADKKESEIKSKIIEWEEISRKIFSRLESLKPDKVSYPIKHSKTHLLFKTALEYVQKEGFLQKLLEGEFKGLGNEAKDLPQLGSDNNKNF